MRSSPRLTRARPEHVPALARFEQRAFTGVYARHRFTEQQFRYFLSAPRTIAQVVTDGSSILGYSLGIRYSGRLSHMARLYSIAVDPERRRGGIGHMLMAGFLRASRQRGCRVVVLEVAAARRSARTLFARHGFGSWKSLPDYYGPGVHGLRLRRILG